LLGTPLELSEGLQDTSFDDGTTRVSDLQNALISLGYLDGEADGSYGSRTAAAVEAFQRNNLIFGSYGIATPFTQAVLFYGDPFPADQINPAPYDKPGKFLQITGYAYSDENDILCVDVSTFNTFPLEIASYSVECFAESNGELLPHTITYTLWVTPQTMRSFTMELDVIPDYREIDTVYLRVSEIYYADGRIYSDCEPPIDGTGCIAISLH